jgi:3-hydroxyisobutyrate dehydrogenase-like beta-hydroxyacid dehydrogenase
MAWQTVGLLHPGEMGAAVGAVLRGQGHRVVWASSGRSAVTRGRADEAGLEDAGSVAELLRRSDVVLSVCPPHAVLEVARSVAGFKGLFVDANAVAPATARELVAVVEAGGGDCVDGGIVGPPPRTAPTTRLYLSGPSAATVADLFAGSAVDARVVSNEIGAASAVKMAYAAWTKGTTALLIAIRELARAEGIEPALLEEWRLSLPELPDQSQRAARSAQAKGWRWIGEMEEIASTFSAADLPDGFHKAAADMFRTLSPDPPREWPHAVQS